MSSSEAGNVATINKLYTSFIEADAAGMASCYAPDAVRAVAANFDG
jgi:hypothetical protein